MRVAALAAVAMLAGCAAMPPPPPATPASPAAAKTPPAPAPLPATVIVRNASFEDADPGRACAPGWDCTAHAGTESFRFFAVGGGAAAGQRSFCVERVTPEPWALVRQLVRHERLLGANLRLTLSVRVEGADGPGAGPWVLVEGPQVVNSSRLVRGSANWAPAFVDFAVPRDATALIVGATLEGPGRACFDDVRLEVRP